MTYEELVSPAISHALWEFCERSTKKVGSEYPFINHLDLFPACYCMRLISTGEALYVGQSVDVNKRIRTHIRDFIFRSNSWISRENNDWVSLSEDRFIDKSPDHILTSLRADIYRVKDRSGLLLVENHLIHTLNPTHRSTHRGVHSEYWSRHWIELCGKMQQSTSECQPKISQ